MRPFENEFAVGVDSVVLSRIDSDRYLITRYSRFVRVDNGKPGDQQALVEKMAGIYDEDKKVINELKKGKVIHFDPEENVMLIGASEYRKVR